ncbi:MAG: 1-acyl-sn-glycerol-3-phosphate acyltransferase [Clostridia bacterium]|nr:1-acyl-sn-glycerol-3-phosphate acyltransferase [Clostridia bacterium]
MEKLGKHEPCLFLMNHSCFLDLKIASTILYPRPFNIVCTSDGFVGKQRLMRRLGCIPINKFVSDLRLVRDMQYALKTLRSSVLMYPEASYSFDGTATPLPSSLGKCVKLLGLPVVMIRTYGAFLHDPLYNGLRLRKTKVSADMEYLLSPDEIKEKTADEINAILADRFSFDHFRWQTENGVKIDEPFRAEGLNRVLYKCPACHTEGEMRGEGAVIFCRHCGKRYTLEPLGFLRAENGETEFSYVTDWYAWERASVREEIENGTYRLDLPVEIRVLADAEAIYHVGKGRLLHTAEGFLLTGCDGALTYRQKPLASYSLYADYFWYEIGDMICIGDNDRLYYCFPAVEGDFVAKARLAAEELYKKAMRELRPRA